MRALPHLCLALWVGCATESPDAMRTASRVAWDTGAPARLVVAPSAPALDLTSRPEPLVVGISNGFAEEEDPWGAADTAAELEDVTLPCRAMTAELDGKRCTALDGR